MHMSDITTHTLISTSTVVYILFRVNILLTLARSTKKKIKTSKYSGLLQHISDRIKY